MVTEEHVLEAVATCNSDRTKTFAEFIAFTFKDKFVEIYLGDSYEDISTEQVSTSYPAVFCGKVVTAFKECLVLKGAYVNQKTKTAELSNLVFISERAIRALNEINGQGIIEDMFLRSKESLDLKEMYIDNKE